jgi:hypothetical protein
MSAQWGFAYEVFHVTVTQHVYLKPLMWSQNIVHYPSMGEGRTGLHVTCVPNANCGLLLSNGAKLRDFEISLSIVEGDLPADEHEKARFENDAIGGLWFLEEEKLVKGWFYFKPGNYKAVWDQVREGRYDECTINLGLKPVQHDIWRSNPVSIVTVAFTFNRKPPVERPAD